MHFVVLFSLLICARGQLRPLGEAGILPTTRPPTACGYSEATCANGECIDREAICDGDIDCSDGSDESSCRENSLCEPNEYQCGNKKCVLKTWRCDGDDDCGDGSDESGCTPNPPGSPCRYYEWQCRSRDQCIPKSFQCDGENDCQDNSDETGCRSPEIVVSPPPLVTVDQSFTFVINCTAMGIPTPQVVWRLNWGHVPDKCSMTNKLVGDNRAFGELTCPMASEMDQGAYSCEAINSMGSCFAGSAGCGQPGQDAILVVNTGKSVCPSGTFNSLAIRKEDCLRCFCFGQTDSCKSADLYTSTLPRPSGTFQLVEVSLSPYREATPSTESLDQSFLRSTRDGQKLYVPNVSSLGIQGVPYFALPQSHTGKQLKSYGGNLKFKIRFQGEGYPLNAPIVIMKGGGYTLAYFSTEQLQPNRENEVIIRFWPGKWFQKLGRNNAQGEGPATREEIMSVLDNIEMILIRAQHLDSGPVDVTISDIRMDSADARDFGQGRAPYVEQCICPAGYTGLSCEICAPGYERQEGGRWKGTCQRPVTECPPGYYGDPATGMECQVCPCPLTTPSNQFARECFLDVDRQVTCRCPPGYTGRRCGECAQGYVGNPTELGSSCERGLSCNPQGSLSSSPDPLTGQCRCRTGYGGQTCEYFDQSSIGPGQESRPVAGQCSEYQFQSLEESAPGCTNCFCMAIPTGSQPTSCKASGLYRDKIRAVFQDEDLDFSLIDSGLENEIPASRLKLDGRSRELSYDRFEEFGDEIYYWKLPSDFLGNKITSYGGYLEFTLRFVPRPGAEEPSDDEPLVELSGNDIRFVHYSEATGQSEKGHHYKVLMHESKWERVDRQGEPANREHMLMALADLEYIIIKAAHSEQTKESSISEVSMDYAQERNTGLAVATAVEECQCPPGYKGLSCENCAPGFTRSGSGLYLGTCVQCQCNGKSSSCHPETGVCLNCRDYTTGPNCEECLPGTVKDPYRGGCRPQQEEGSGETCACDPMGSISSECGQSGYCECKQNVEGRNCDRCKPGSFGMSMVNDDGCLRCYCSEVTDECNEARLYWSTLRMPIYDENHGFSLTDRRQTLNKEGDLQFLSASSELKYQYGGGDRRVYYWSLPYQFLGNKIGSYGGNMTVLQQFTTRSERGTPLIESDVIMSGNGVSLHLNFQGERAPNTEERNKIPLYENGWFNRRGGARNPATREDFLRILSNIESILVRATVARDMDTASIKKVAMDIAVPQMTGGPPTIGAEECRCPPGYKGYSCEECASGYFRDVNDVSEGPLGKCEKCPCNGNEQSCSKERNGRVQCVCKDGWSGPYCDYRGQDYQPPPQPSPNEPPIFITVSEPRIQIVEIGQTVKFDCNARPRFQTRDQLSITWAKENGVLPAGRATDNGRGVLIITQVQSDDSGTYVCTATAGQFVVTERAQLTVGRVPGREETYERPPRVVINPQYKQATEGDMFTFQCEAEGTPTPQISWSRADGYPLSNRASVRGSSLTFRTLSKQDEGPYICTASNRAGSQETRAMLYVQERSGYRPDQTGGQTGGQYEDVSISPQDITAQTEEDITLTCRFPPGYASEWSKLNEQLPYSASQESGLLTIRRATIDDSGIYVCTATSPSGDSRKAQARVNVEGFRGGPPTVRIEPETQTIGQGQSSELKCIASGNPTPKITWEKVGGDLTSPNIVESGNTLMVRNALEKDGGMYLCTAENAGGAARASSILTVEKREPPTIDIYPEESQTITTGGSVLFQCRTVTGIPTPKVTWTREDRRPMGQNAEILSGGVLRITRVTGSEAGRYKCTAENEAGRIEAFATLTIHQMPSIQMSPQGSVIIPLGRPLSIRCTATGEPTPAIKWNKVGSTTRQVGSSSPTFEIRSVTKQDEGTYACVASNAAGEVEEWLQVIVSEDDNYGQEEDRYQGGRNPQQNQGIQFPQDNQGYYGQNQGDRYGGNNQGDRYGGNNRGDRYGQGSEYDRLNQDDRYGEQSQRNQYPNRGDQGYSPDNRYQPRRPVDNPVSMGDQTYYVEPGNNIQLKADVVGNMASSINTVWRRGDGQAIDSRHYQRNNILYINSASPSDEGTYVCEGRDNSGNVVFEYNAILRIAASPRIRLEPRQQTVRPGDSPTIECQVVQGDQPVRIQWSREGYADLPRTVSQNQAILQFRRIAVSDQGRYVCKATNKAGEAEAVAEVIVNENMLPNLFPGGFAGLNQLRSTSGPASNSQSQNMTVSQGPIDSQVQQATSQESEDDYYDSGLQIITASGADRGSSENAQDTGLTLLSQSSTSSGGEAFKENAGFSFSSGGMSLFNQQRPAFTSFSRFDAGDDSGIIETKQVSSTQGATVDLPCRLAPSDDMKWERLQGSLPKQAKQVKTALRIERVTEEDSGKYICSSQGRFQYVNLMVERIVENPGKPEISIRTSSPVAIMNGALDVTCQVNKLQRGGPKIAWSKMGQDALDSNTISRGNMLRIDGLTKENEGVYRCTVETESGTFFKEYILSVQGSAK